MINNKEDLKQLIQVAIDSSDRFELAKAFELLERYPFYKLKKYSPTQISSRLRARSSGSCSGCVKPKEQETLVIESKIILKRLIDD